MLTEIGVLFPYMGTLTLFIGSMSSTLHNTIISKETKQSFENNFKKTVNPKRVHVTPNTSTNAGLSIPW